MHDFLLAKEIMDTLKEISIKQKLKNIKRVSLEIGKITLAHDNFPDHAEEINLKNLEFGLKNLANGSVLKETEFIIRSTTGSSWKIVEIEVK